MLNKVQLAAYDLIQSDARFLFSLINIHLNANKITSNFIMMSQPYIGIFAHGAEQWCRKLCLDSPKFTKSEEEYYKQLRLSHKLYEIEYNEYLVFLMSKLKDNDKYYSSIRRMRERMTGYYNVGTDIINGKFCGNTILCDMYSYYEIFEDKDIGHKLREISVVVGRLIAYFNCLEFPPFRYKNSTKVSHKDFHFFKNCPLKMKSELGFVLFSILCSINFVIEFIDKYFEEEIPQKFKFAYLQYYYLCDFVDQLNVSNNTNFKLNKNLKNRDFRNCLAHYGLGQYISKNEIITEDVLKGLTKKAFNLNYFEAKELLFSYLKDLIMQIELEIF